MDRCIRLGSSSSRSSTGSRRARYDTSVASAASDALWGVGGGVYAVELEENIEGASASRLCDVKIENWKYVGEITSADTDGYKEIPVDDKSALYRFKIELRGNGTTIEKAQIINTIDKKAQ